ncbi:MAG: FadR/GntR family transcriptional regulator, partial [Sphaerochaetaceae bacterium]
SVSRASVRHAIASLVAKNLLTVQQGSGTFVAMQENNDRFPASLLEELCWNLAEQQISLTEIAESRLLIECEVVRLCAIKADDAVCKKLDSLLERKRIAQGDTTSYEEMNRDLHLTIAEGSGNKVLKLLMIYILQLMKENMWPWAKSHMNSSQKLLQNHLNQHEALVAAIIAHDSQRASQVMFEHLGGITNEMSMLYEYETL